MSAGPAAEERRPASELRPRDSAADCVLGLLARRRGVDVRDWRPEVLERGLRARALATGCADLDAYRARVERDPAELDRLFEAVVVRVSGFFRDPAVFEALERRVIPELAARRSPETPLRAWTIGAATGEEAYSLAMLLAAAATSLPALDFEVLATDVDDSALAAAREARYSALAAAAVPPPLAARFLVPEAGGALLRVAEPVRARVRFARHDLAKPRHAPPEAVLASFDLVLLRNVLLYFDERLRERAIERVAGALRPGEGVLVLGLSESLPPGARAKFEPIDAALRIYRRAPAGPRGGAP